MKRIILIVVCVLLVVFAALPAIGQQTGSSSDIEKLVTERYFEGAYNYYQEGQYDMAIKYYNIVLSRDPNHAKALYWLARLYQELGLFKQALATWQRLLVVQPDNKIAKYFAKKCKGIIKHGEEAYDTYERAYDVYLRGNKERALRLYEKVCALSPTFEKAFLWAGRVSFELGYYDKAEWYLQRALNLDPKDKIAKYLLNQVRKAKK
ncbi:MAG: tetratricopeptide repeat protein [Synergistetes bacterium]|nr:tetratricopeptide repeat protein [Synergistota bacterium]